MIYNHSADTFEEFGSNLETILKRVEEGYTGEQIRSGRARINFMKRKNHKLNAEKINKRRRGRRKEMLRTLYI